MKGERRLRLVPSGPPEAEERAQAASGGDEEPPPTEAELREATALQEALERGVDPLAASLRSAFRPEALEDADHDAILARALGDLGAPATKAEQREAERLAGELEAMRGARMPHGMAGSMSDGAEIASALRAAWAPRPIEQLRNEALIAGALHKAPARRSGRRVLSVTMAALTSVAAVAAAVALYFGRAGELGPPTSQTAATPPTAGVVAVAQTALIRARSTADLFDPETPFPRTGGTSERIDRIASARAADLRANRFAAWGVP
jgi:hypothetical protein